jgi:hypothetical protein
MSFGVKGLTIPDGRSQYSAAELCVTTVVPSNPSTCNPARSVETSHGTSVGSVWLFVRHGPWAARNGEVLSVHFDVENWAKCFGFGTGTGKIADGARFDQVFCSYTCTARAQLWLCARGGAVGWGIALQAGRSRVLFPMSSGPFIGYILPAPLWSLGRLSL